MIEQKIEDWAKLATDVFSDNREKGFWGDKTKRAFRRRADVYVLIISEMAEAVEADRKGRKILNKGQGNVIRKLSESLEAGDTHQYKKSYESLVKGTVSEELADVLIRMLDYAGYKKWDITPDLSAPAPKRVTDIFPEDCKLGKFSELAMECIDFIGMARKQPPIMEKEMFRNAFLAVYTVAEYLAIPIDSHIMAKIHYNRTRAHMHGKKY